MVLGTGNANGRPVGITTLAADGVTTAASKAVTYGELVDLDYAIDEAYLTGEVGLLGPGAGPDVRSGGQIGYIFSRAFEQLARKMVDSNGHPLWQLDLNVGSLAVGTRPAMFMGKPYRTNAKMPGVAAGTRPLLYGNLSYFGARIVNGLYVRSFYDSFTALNGNIMFIGRMRMDSNALGAINANKCEAFTALRMKP